MPNSVTCTDVRIVPETGKWYVAFSDGTSLEFSSLQDMKDTIAEVDADPVTARRILIAWWLARSPDGSNQNLVEGKTLTFDLSAPNPIRVQ